MVDVFKAFPKSVQPMSFLELNQGGILGNTVKQRWEFGGILKDIKGKTVDRNMSLQDSPSRLHIRPDEPFIPILQEYGKTGFLKCAIEATKNGVTSYYSITGYPEGYNFHDGRNEFFWVTLKTTSLADYDLES